MATMRRRKIPRPACAQKQRGVVLLVILLVTITFGGYFGVRALNANKARNSGIDEHEAAQILVQAKSALLAWSVITIDNPFSATYPVTGNVGLRAFRPGNLPYPDLVTGTSISAAIPSDGVRDNGCASRSWAGSGTLRPVDAGLDSTERLNLRCFGRLPLVTLGLERLASNAVDTAGRWPWYAVSANLVATNDVCPGYLDSRIANSGLPSGTNVCVNGTLPTVPFPWLTVRDQYGSVLSNRVAAVVILPGPVTGRQPGNVTQNRSTSTTGLPARYLDTVENAFCPAGMCDNGLINQNPLAFIQCVNPAITSGDNRFNTNYACTDRLIYITVDELLNHAAKRVEREFVDCLKEYATANGGRYPWAANASPSDVSIGQYAGMFPSSGVPGEPSPLTPCPNAQNGSASAYLSGWQWGAAYTLTSTTRLSARFAFAFPPGRAAVTVP